MLSSASRKTLCGLFVCALLVRSTHAAEDTRNVSAASEAAAGEEEARMRELRRQILSRYNKTVPPSFEDSPTDTGFFLLGTRLVGLDDLTATMTFEGYLLVNWVDRRLSWLDEPAFNGTDVMSVSSEELWKPNINVFNRGRGTSYGLTGVPTFCLKDGTVWWWLAAELHPVCVPEDLRWFPTDTHTCRLELGALYPQEFLSIMFDNPDNDAHHGSNGVADIESSFWDLLALDHQHDYVSDHTGQFFSVDRYTFKIKRQRPVLVLAFVSLMLSCSAISWSSLALPATDGALTRRQSLTTSALVLQSLFLSALVGTTPGVAVRPPIIVKVYAYFVVLAFLTSLHTVLLPSLFFKLGESSAIFHAMPPPLQYLLGVDKPSRSRGLLDQEEVEERSGPVPDQSQRESVDRQTALEAWDRAHLLMQALLVIFGVTALVLV